MAKLYKIRAGFSFVVEYGVVATGGDTIELEDDVYQMHAHKLELVTPDVPVPAVKAGAKAAAATDQTAAAPDQPA